MLLPLLIIFLVLICAYLEYQKNINLHNKIFVCVICVIVFVLCYSFIKKYDENYQNFELQTHDDFVSSEEMKEEEVQEEVKEEVQEEVQEEFKKTLKKQKKEGFKNKPKNKHKKEKFLGKLHCFPDPKTKKPKETFLERYYNTSKKTGYSYIPDMFWTMPERRPPVCIPQNKSNPSEIILNPSGEQFLELDETTGFIATTEDKVKFTNVGSIMPKFNFTETVDPKDY